MTVIVATRYAEEAGELCDRVALMDRGRVLACDTPHAVISSLVEEAVVSTAGVGLRWRYHRFMYLIARARILHEIYSRRCAAGQSHIPKDGAHCRSETLLWRDVSRG